MPAPILLHKEPSRNLGRAVSAFVQCENSKFSVLGSEVASLLVSRKLAESLQEPELSWVLEGFAEAERWRGKRWFHLQTGWHDGVMSAEDCEEVVALFPRGVPFSGMEPKKSPPIDRSAKGGHGKLDQKRNPNDDSIAPNLMGLLRKRLQDCCNIPPAAREAQLVVKVHFALNIDGTVIGLPEVLNGSADPLFQATAQSAVSAILECQALRFPAG